MVDSSLGVIHIISSKNPNFLKFYEYTVIKVPGESLSFRYYITPYLQCYINIHLLCYNLSPYFIYKYIFFFW